LASKTINDPPREDVVEISIFGPGLGECCLLHVGWNEWVIVDSCIDQRSGVHPALSYLEGIGVDPDAVRLVVATHAHNDHIAGMASVVASCINAEFVVSAAATKEEFFALMQFDKSISNFVRPSAYSEYRKIQAILGGRACARGGKGVPAYTYAVADRPLYKRGAASGSAPACITALSPSDEAITRARTHLAGLFPSADEIQKRLRPPDPNTFSVALWVEVGEVALLLGSDLLRGPGQSCGWSAVLGSSLRPSGRAELFKVPHHGAPNAHHERVWSELLIENPVALIAPYRAGANPRPSAEDADRICHLTDRAYISARPDLPSRSAKVRRAASNLAGIAQNVSELEGTPGQVRARRRISEPDWGIDLVWPAVSLDKAFG
jgi:hypothetical protein